MVELGSTFQKLVVDLIKHKTVLPLDKDANRPIQKIIARGTCHIPILWERFAHRKNFLGDYINRAYRL